MTLKILSIIYFGFFLSENVCAQNSEQAIANIKAYVKMVGSLSSINTYLQMNNDEEPRLVLSIAEGFAKNAKRGLRGGFERTTITRPSGDTVYAIKQEDNLMKNLTQSYYFISDKLVFCRIEVLDDNDTSAILFHQEEFYQDDKVIRSTIVKNELRKKHKWRIDFNHMGNGYYYLKEFKKGRSGN